MATFIDRIVIFKYLNIVLYHVFMARHGSPQLKSVNQDSKMEEVEKVWGSD